MILNDMVPSTGKNICGTVTGKSYAVTSAFFCNTSDSATDVLNLYVVSATGGVGTQSLIAKNISIAATDTFALDTEKIILENGDYIWAISNNGNISAVLSVMDIS